MSRDINKLHPLDKMLGEAYVEKCKAAGLNVKITDCVRDKDEQNACFKNGTSSVIYPYSHHNWGLAFDICQNVKDNPYPSPATKEGKAFWDKAVSIGRNMGMTCGADWVNVDRPHFQIDAYGSAADLINKYSLPQYFFRSNEFKIVTPTKPITPLSLKKKILWLQVRLVINDCPAKLTGKWDDDTRRALRIFWRTKTGKKCTGNLCSVNCIKMLE